MSQPNVASNELATGMKYVLLAGAGAGIAYLIFFNAPQNSAPVFDRVLDALPAPVKEIIQPVAGLEKSGYDLAKEAADKGITTESGAKSAASSIFKATPYGRLSSVLDPHNSDENRIAQFALNALSVNPVLAAVNWALPAPKMEYDSPVQKWCDMTVHNIQKMKILAAGKPDLSPNKMRTVDGWKKAQVALEDYNEALADISPCLSTPAQWQTLQQKSRDQQKFDGRDASSFATDSGFLTVGYKDLPRPVLNDPDYIAHHNLSNPYSRVYEVDEFHFDKVGSAALGDKTLIDRFVPHQQSMLSSDYWKGIFD